MEDLVYIEEKWAYWCETTCTVWRVVAVFKSRVPVLKRERPAKSHPISIHKSKKKKCFICEFEASYVPCSAIKVWEFYNDRKKVTVYHKGMHTCHAIPLNQTDVGIEQQLEEDFKKHASLKPSEAASNTMVAALKDGNSSWEEIDKMAYTLADTRRIQDTKAKVKRSLELHGHSLDALCQFKKFCDQKDPYLVYKINDERQNGDLTYVFQCSRFQAQLALSMDSSKDGVLHGQYCYADATHKHCPGFKTITTWVYHPLLRKLVKLATMESMKEDTDAMIKFWSLFNEILQDITGDPQYVFNPTGWVLDEAGAQWNAVRIVFGEQSIPKVIGCEFHYKQSVGRKAAKLTEPDKSEFETLADALLQANTVSTFEKKRADINRFIKERPKERGFLSTWVSWWIDRKTHIFRAFKATMLTPRMNMAETGHSTWVKSGAIQLSLVDAARHDVGENIRLEKMVERFMEGSARPTGKGPSSTESERLERQRQIQRANEYGKEILAEEFEGDPYSPGSTCSLVDPTASHSPTKRGKPKRKQSIKNNPSNAKPFSKQLLHTIEVAKSEATEFDVKQKFAIATDHQKYHVMHGEKLYEVDICHTPSCSCPDNRTCHCKHVLWVLMFVFDVQEDSPILKEKKFSKDLLDSLFTRKQRPDSSQSGQSQPCAQDSSLSQPPPRHILQPAIQSLVPQMTQSYAGLQHPRFIRFFFSTLTVIVSILFFRLSSNQIRQQALVSYQYFVNSDFR
ncbi:hypothetical protein QZH41_012837 [Actinostola sp. cb2023]|nr:hypothetical protein QZH41_012837 [Actinostola sp. cb2023]